MSDPLRLTLTVEGQGVSAKYEGEADGGRISKDEEGPFDLDDIKREMVNVLVAWLREERLRPTEAELLGKILHRALFSKSVENFFHESRADFHSRQGRDARFPVQLQLDEGLIGYPWEFLHGPVAPGTEPIFLSTSGKLVLSRYAPSEEWDDEHPQALKTLVVTSLPRDILDRLPAEIGSYDPMVAKIGEIPSIEIVEPVLTNPTKEALERALDKHKPHAVHYIGHGRRVETEDGLVGQIALCEPEDAKCSWVKYSDLVESFQRAESPPKLVFLHLCPGPTAEGGFARPSFTELAYRLSRVPIQAVLGMQYPLAIDQDLSQGFTEAFYKGVAEEGLVGAAIQAGRSLVYNKSAKQNYFGIWNIGKPVLYTSSERLLSPSAGAMPGGSHRSTSPETRKNGQGEDRPRQSRQQFDHAAAGSTGREADLPGQKAYGWDPPE